MRFKPFVLVLILFCILAAPAWAQETVEDEAVEHFEAGADLFFEEKYEEAIEEFMAGHRISPNAMFLYNVSLAQVKLGNLDEALEAARAARGLDGLDSTTLIQNEGRIAALELLEKTRKISQPEEGETESQKEIVMIPRAAPAESALGTLGYAGIGVSLVGVGLLITMAAIEVSLQDKWSAYEAEGQFGNEERFLSLRSEIRDMQTLGLIFMASGAGVTAIGLAMIIIDLTNDGESGVSAYVAPTSDSAVVGFGGRF